MGAVGARDVGSGIRDCQAVTVTCFGPEDRNSNIVLFPALIITTSKQQIKCEKGDEETRLLLCLCKWLVNVQRGEGNGIFKDAPTIILR